MLHASTSQPHEEREPESDATEIKRNQFVKLLPLIVGFAAARTGIIASTYSSYTQTDANFLSDGTSLFTSLILIVLLVFIAGRNVFLNKGTVNRIARVCFAFQTISIIALGFLSTSGYDHEPVYLVAGIANAVVSPCAMFYWTRRARGSSSSVAAIFVFSAIALSEVEIFACSLLPTLASHILAAAFALLQFPAMLFARKATQPYEMPHSESHDSLSFMKDSIKSKSVLVSSALGVAALGLTIGLLRGYPNGEAVSFDAASRCAYMMLTIAVCALVVALCVKGRRGILTTGIWIIMFALSCCALTSYAAWGANLQIGAIFATTVNALMVGYCAHLAISFMTYGWRDPYYYAIAGWLAFFLPRAIGRIVLSSIYPLNTNTELMLAIMGDAALVSALLVFVRFLNVARTPPQTLVDHERSTLQKLMALNDTNEIAATTAMRHNAISQGVSDIGKRFMLSARETEVLSLYALGHTQKKIAEELFITAGTVHEHIRHIYTKTGFHSRQEILDYVNDSILDSDTNAAGR